VFKLLITGAAVVVAFAVIMSVCELTQPDRFEVRRSANIKASADAIFPLIDNPHVFNTWNSSDKTDPNIKGSYAGSDSGAGQPTHWRVAKSETGRVETVEAVPPSTSSCS
jgi:hypothetical protein